MSRHGLTNKTCKKERKKTETECADVWVSVLGCISVTCFRGCVSRACESSSFAFLGGLIYEVTQGTSLGTLEEIKWI